MTGLLTMRGALGVRSRAENWTPYAHQIPPEEFVTGEKGSWLLKGGRGSGKTDAMARYVRDHLMTLGPRARVGIGAPTIGAVRDICAEGETGLITTFREEFSYRKSLLDARHMRGGYVKFMGTEEPDRWNGPQWTLLWFDELALCVRESFDQAQFGLRLGPQPQTVISTTPKMKKWVRDLAESDEVAVTHGTMYDNPALVESVRNRLERRYGGTRLGRQELLGEFIGDIEGSLWQAAWIDDNRRPDPPTLVEVRENEETGEPEEVKILNMPRIVVAIDPAVTKEIDSDETGIAVGGSGPEGDYWILGVEGRRDTPMGWANRAIDIYLRWQADKIVAETNNGGDMVVDTIMRAAEARGITVNVEKIHASRGKTVRAEPAAALYEQGRVHHVGVFTEAEEQLCSFPIANEHDDLVDAVVYVLSELANEGAPNLRFL
jgi:predicted phage terminase large subunit-like protein